MAENNLFKGEKKLRKAKIITLPNTIKQKIGSGGLDAATLAEAEKVLTENTVDFRPIAEGLLKELAEAIEAARNSEVDYEALIEAMIYPAAQFKAQGSMFGFPLVSDISDILINFLETISTPPAEEALDIITAHKMAISVVINSGIKERFHPQGEELKRSLMEACQRYYKSRKA
jgi:hypothetical protein